MNYIHLTKRKFSVFQRFHVEHYCQKTGKKQKTPKEPSAVSRSCFATIYKHIKYFVKAQSCNLTALKSDIDCHFTGERSLGSQNKQIGAELRFTHGNSNQE